MRVIVMIKATPQSEAGRLPSDRLLEEMGHYNEALARAGVLLAGEGLQPSHRGVRVRFRGRERAVSEGPFAETRELLAGFWLWQVRSMEEAVEWVRRCPNPHDEDTEVEIRPVLEMEDFADACAPQPHAYASDVPEGRRAAALDQGPTPIRCGTRHHVHPPVIPRRTHRCNCSPT